MSLATILEKSSSAREVDIFSSFLDRKQSYLILFLGSGSISVKLSLCVIASLLFSFSISISVFIVLFCSFCVLLYCG